MRLQGGSNCDGRRMQAPRARCLPLTSSASAEEDPSASSPLTYRETAWSVPEGTSIDAAVRLLTGMFEGVRASLAGSIFAGFFTCTCAI